MIVFHDLNETSTFPPVSLRSCPNLFTLRDFCIPESPLRSFSCLTVESFGVRSDLGMKKMRGALKKKKDHNLKPFRPPFPGPIILGPSSR